MLRIATDFYFLGERTYVHGPTILGAFLETLDVISDPSGRPVPTRIVSCRFRRYIRENGTLTAWEESEDRPDFTSGEVCATATIAKTGHTYRFALLHEGGSPIARRVPYDEDVYLQDVTWSSDFAGEGTIQNIRSRKDLLRAIVAFNKRLHILTTEGRAPTVTYRWSFASVEGLELPSVSQEMATSSSLTGSLSLGNVSVWNVEGNLHSLSRGALEVPGFPGSCFRIGFAGQPR